MSQQDLANVMMRFRIDVTEATNALIYTLYGINLVHLTAQGGPSNSFPVPGYPPLKVLPQVIGNTSFFDRTAPNGPIEQLAFKAWVAEVYDSLWERIYRTTLTQHFREITPRATRLEAEVNRRPETHPQRLGAYGDGRPVFDMQSSAMVQSRRSDAHEIEARPRFPESDGLD